MNSLGVRRIFLTLNGTDGTYNLPKPMNTDNSVIALTEISGTITPRLTTGNLYLCCNIVKWSLGEIGKQNAGGGGSGGGTDLTYLPIISRINHRKTRNNGTSLNSTVRSTDQPKALFVECDSERVESINLYLIDETGRRPSVESCELNCTLTLRNGR